MFSPDGKKLVFSSNRMQKQTKEKPMCSSRIGLKVMQPEIATKVTKKHISYLASDELQRTFNGFRRREKAADYIAKRIQSFRIKTLC